MFDLYQFDQVGLYLDGQKIGQVQNLDFSDSSDRSPIKAIGDKFVKIDETGPKSTAVSFSRYDFNNDPLYDYIINSELINGGFVAPNVNIGFQSGIITNYTARGQIGSFPTVEYQMEVWGNAGSSISIASGNGTFPVADAVVPRKINVSCEGASSNKVKSYSYSLSLPTNPLYFLGERNPKDIKSNAIEVRASFDLEVDDLQSYGAYKTFTAPKLNNITISLTGCNSNLVREYKLVSADMVSQNFSMTVDGTYIASIEYIGYL